MKKLGLMMSALVFVAGCGKADNGSPAAGPACASGVTCPVTVTAEQAPTYFKQYQYQTVGTCADKTLRFTWLALSDRIVIAKTADGNDIVAEVNIYLDPAGTYTGEYQENTQKRIEEGFYQTIESKNKRDLTGNWSTVGTQLVIDNLGNADAVTVRNWPGIKIDKSVTDLNPLLVGKKLVFVNFRSIISKDGKTADQYCSEAH
jgi:hypothetical protein